jgi:hypothetical protein
VLIHHPIPLCLLGRTIDRFFAGFSDNKVNLLEQGMMLRSTDDIQGQEVYLGHNNNLIPRKIQRLDRIPKYDFALTVRVDVCGVEGVDARIISIDLRIRWILNKRQRMSLRSLNVFNPLFLWKNPVLPRRFTIGHHPKNNLGHFQTRITQSHCESQLMLSRLALALTVLHVRRGHC